MTSSAHNTTMRVGVWNSLSFTVVLDQGSLPESDRLWQPLVAEIVTANAAINQRAVRREAIDWDMTRSRKGMGAGRSDSE